MSVHTARLSEEGADRISVKNFQTQAEVSPGDTVAWSFTILNNADVNVLDPDWCEQLFPPASGVRMFISVEFAGAEDIRQGVCVPDEGGESDFSGEFIAPTQPGDYEVTVNVEANNTQRQIAQQSRTVTVLGEGEQPVGDCPAGFQRDPQTGECVPVGGGDNGDNGDGDNGFNLPDFGNVAGNPLVILAFLLVVLFILTSASE